MNSVNEIKIGNVYTFDSEEGGWLDAPKAPEKVEVKPEEFLDIVISSTTVPYIASETKTNVKGNAEVEANSLELVKEVHSSDTNVKVGFLNFADENGEILDYS